MFKKLFMIAVPMALVLSACGEQAPTETVEPAPTETQAAIATEAPTIEATETTPEIPTETPDSVTATSEIPPTPSIPRPENEPGCTNSAAFVSDVTIPDNTVIDAGETFTKTWRISNTGTCIWAWDYGLTYYSEERLGAPDVVPLDVTYPGQTVDISVDLTAPNAPGSYRGNFVIENPDGLIMQVGDDSRLWLIISVENTAAPTPTPTAASSSVSPTNASSSTSGTSSVTDECSFATDRAKLTETIDALNVYRAQNGLPAFTVNNLLARAAQRHASDIACNNLFVHTGSDGSTPESRVAETGYKASSMSENVYGSYPPLNGPGVIKWWVDDKTDVRHGQNLLSRTFTEIGVGYAFFDNFGYYVIVFAKP